jgi:cytosine/adenosine deaminase-related metal-dependent hydrolase
MLQRTFFRGPVLITLDPPTVEAADLLVEDGRVARKGWRLAAPRDAEIVDARGRILMPGLVNARVRLDASFARTLPMPPARPEDVERLQAAGTEETAICAAFSVGIEAMRAGCTTLFCVHDAAGFVRGALGRMRDVMSTIGLRSTVACALRGGPEAGATEDVLREAREAASFGSDGKTAFVLGLGDAAAIADPALAALAEAAGRSETPLSGVIGLRSDAAADVARLRKAGLLRRRSVLLCLGPLPGAERDALAAEGVTLVRSPWAEAHFGRRSPARLEGGPGAALGTDAGRPDLFEEARAAFARAREAGEPVTAQNVVAMLAQAARIASDAFRTRLGSFEPGAAADLLVLDYRPAAPLNPESVCQHVLFGLSSACVQHVMVDGHLVVRDRLIANVDVRNLFRQTQRGALDLWQRAFRTEYPGLKTPMKAAPAEAEARERPRETRRYDEEDVEIEPLEVPADAIKPWLVCKPGAEPEPAAASPRRPALPRAAEDAPPRKAGGGFGDGIL